MVEEQQLSTHLYVECKQGVCGGRPVLKGTRFPFCNWIMTSTSILSRPSDVVATKHTVRRSVGIDN